MTIQELLYDLREAGYKFMVDKDKLKCQGEKPLTPEVVETLKQHKAEIIGILQSCKPARMPTLSECDIRIPFDCPDRYRWWDDRIAGKLSLKEIRAELQADPANN